MGPVTRKRKADEAKLPSHVPPPKNSSKHSKPREINEPVASADGEPNMHSLEIKDGDKSITCKKYLTIQKETNEDKHSITPSLIFTHGAGGGIETPAVVEFAKGFATQDNALCFQGTMNLKARVKSYHAVIENQDWGIALGGRSMGARAAVMTANEHDKTEVLVLVSYPLVSEKGDVRDEILLEVSKDVQVLFIIGDGDKMCPLDRLHDVREQMKATSWLAVVKGADHGMAVKPKSATGHVVRETGKVAAQWLKEKDAKKLETVITWNEEAGEAATTAWSGDDSTRKSKPETATEQEDRKDNGAQASKKREKRVRSS